MMVGSWGTGQSKKKDLNWGAEPVNKALGRLVRGPKFIFPTHRQKSQCGSTHLQCQHRQRKELGDSSLGLLASPVVKLVREAYVKNKAADNQRRKPTVQTKSHREYEESVNPKNCRVKAKNTRASCWHES